MMVTHGTKRGRHPGLIAARVCGITVSCAMMFAAAAGGAAPARQTEYASGTAVATKTQDVFGILHEGTISGELYIANDFQIDQSGTVIDYGVTRAGAPVAETVGKGEHAAGTSTNTLTKVSSGLKAMPWAVHVQYSLNGPNVDSSAISGANGLVGLHVTVSPNPLADTDYARTTIPIIAFTVPKIENWSKQLERLKEYSQKRDFCNASEFSAYMGVSRTTTNTWKNLGYITYQGNKIDVQGTIRLWENLHWLF